MHRILPAAAFALVVPAAASAVVIDNFDDGAFVLTAAGSSDDRPSDRTTVTGDPSNILGGQREVTLNLNRGRGVVDARTLANIESTGDGGVLALSDSGRAFSELVLSYRNLGGVDLTEGGTQDAFLLDYDFFQGFSRVAALVRSGAGTGTGVVFVAESDNDRIVGPASRANAQQRLIAFADFNGTVDFGDVDSVEFFINSQDSALGGATDFELDSITTVPEPAGLALLAAGAALLRRRR